MSPVFVEALVGAATRLDLHLVLPMTDITSAVLAERRDAFAPQVRVAVPDADTFWRASDKNALHRLADQLGVPTPTTQYVDRGELPDMSGIPVPCVIKPARSRVRTESGWVKTAVLRADSADEAAALLNGRPELRYGCMIQRVVEGDGVGLFALCDRGEPRLLFAHRRLREKPPWGGVSVLREAVAIDPVAADYATRLLRALCWHGVAMVEFKRESRDSCANPDGGQRQVLGLITVGDRCGREFSSRGREAVARGTDRDADRVPCGGTIALAVGRSRSPAVASVRERTGASRRSGAPGIALRFLPVSASRHPLRSRVVERSRSIAL
jgi:hypothetical protein